MKRYQWIRLGWVLAGVVYGFVAARIDSDLLTWGGAALIATANAFIPPRKAG